MFNSPTLWIHSLCPIGLYSHDKCAIRHSGDKVHACTLSPECAALRGTFVNANFATR